MAFSFTTEPLTAHSMLHLPAIHTYSPFHFFEEEVALTFQPISTLSRTLALQFHIAFLPFFFLKWTTDLFIPQWNLTAAILISLSNFSNTSTLSNRDINFIFLSSSGSLLANTLSFFRHRLIKKTWPQLVLQIVGSAVRRIYQGFLFSWIWCWVTG